MYFRNVHKWRQLSSPSVEQVESVSSLELVLCLSSDLLFTILIVDHTSVFIDGANYNIIERMFKI